MSHSIYENNDGTWRIVTAGNVAFEKVNSNISNYETTRFGKIYQTYFTPQPNTVGGAVPDTQDLVDGTASHNGSSLGKLGQIFKNGNREIILYKYVSTDPATGIQTWIVKLGPATTPEDFANTANNTGVTNVELKIDINVAKGSHAFGEYASSNNSAGYIAELNIDISGSWIEKLQVGKTYSIYTENDNAQAGGINALNKDGIVGVYLGQNAYNANIAVFDVTSAQVTTTRGGFIIMSEREDVISSNDSGLNLVPPELDTVADKRPFADTTSADVSGLGVARTIQQAVFLMKDDYVNSAGNIILGNLNNAGFMILLMKLLKPDVPITMNEIHLASDLTDTSASKFLKNVVIVKEDFQGRMNRSMRRLTNADGKILPTSAELKINSIVNVYYNENMQTPKNVIIQIKEDMNVLSFDVSAGGVQIDQTITLSDTIQYYDHGKTSVLKYYSGFDAISNGVDSTGSAYQRSVNLADPQDQSLAEFDNTGAVKSDYVPILRLNYEHQKDLLTSQMALSEIADWDELAHTLLKTRPDGVAGGYTNYEDIYEVHYCITRNKLESLDTLADGTNNEAPNLDLGNNYIILAHNGDNDFELKEAIDTRKLLYKIEFVPILNEILNVYYKRGEAILKKNISDRVYYRDALGYISQMNYGVYLNKNIEYFIEKEIMYEKRTLDATNQVQKSYEKRKYRLYLDFIESPTEYDYTFDQKLYNNNILVTPIKLSSIERVGGTGADKDEAKHEVCIKFSADNTKLDMYTVLLSDQALIKSVNSTGHVAVNYATLIEEIMANMGETYGDRVYDSEIFIGSIQVKSYVDAVGSNYQSDPQSVYDIKPADALLQKIIISRDGSTTGADAIVIDLTMFVNLEEPDVGLLLQDLVQKQYGQPNFRVRVLQEERNGHRINKMSYLDARKDLVFNGIYSLYLGPNSSKIRRVVLRERNASDIVQFDDNSGVPNVGLNVDQELVMTSTAGALSVTWGTEFDFVKIIGGDKTTVKPSETLVVEHLGNAARLDANGNFDESCMRQLIPRSYFMQVLESNNYEHLYILNNNKRADPAKVGTDTADVELGVGLLKIKFTTLVNKVLNVYYDANNELDMEKSSLNKRIYYTDSLLNDYVSDLHANTGKFNIEGKYFVEIVLDNVTYRCRLQFMPMPHIYTNTPQDANGADMEFKFGTFVASSTKFANVYGLDVDVNFSSDKTENDMHTITLAKETLLNAVDNTGNIMLSYNTIVRNVEKEMKELFGKSYYDREMFLWEVKENGRTILGGEDNGLLVDPTTGNGNPNYPFELSISPLEFQDHRLIEIDMDLNTVEFRQQLPTEKWDFSVKQYGEYIVGDYNVETGKTRVVVNTVVLSQAGILFDERNPSFNFKEVKANVGGSLEKVEVACGNVDPTTLKNVLQKVTLYGPDLQDIEEIHGAQSEMNIVPSFLMNSVVVDDSGNNNGLADIDAPLGSGLNNNKANANFYGHNVTTLMTKQNPLDEVADNVYEPILRKFASGGVFTQFNRFTLVNISRSRLLAAGGLDPNYPDPVKQFVGLISQNLKELSSIHKQGTTIHVDQDITTNKLFATYNRYGKLEEDLNNYYQNPSGMMITANNGFLPYDLDEFKYTVLVKFKGSLNTGDTENFTGSVADKKIAFLKLIQQFFANSNVFLSTEKDANDNVTDHSLRYETTVKCQFINKKVLDTTDYKKLLDNLTAGTYTHDVV